MPGHWCLLLKPAGFLVLDLAALLVGKVRHPHVVGLVISLSNDGKCFHEDSCCG